MINIVLAIYNFAWRLVLPFLHRSPRLELGWQQRTLQEIAEGPFDLWVQAASGGESMLTCMVLETLASLLPKEQKFRILATSGTKQGIDSLTQWCASLPPGNNLDITPAYFPFDAPQLMKRAFHQFQPNLAVILETELWPGFLFAAKKSNVPVLLVNGRMSEKSFATYKFFAQFFKKYGPDRVLAISPADGERFARIVGSRRVSLMNNLKFDRIKEPENHIRHNLVEGLLLQDSPFVLLGSIRRQEEEKILNVLVKVLDTRPDITIGLFPKHIERADRWLELLAQQNIVAVKRSEIVGHQPAGSVIVWDVFGELAGAYALARAAFVGGSLADLGGQNFLEPLVFGVKPIIGPYWQDFAWVGREIVASGLVQEVADENELLGSLLSAIDRPASRKQVIEQAREFFLPKRGGSHQVCRLIIETLDGVGG